MRLTAGRDPILRHSRTGSSILWAHRTARRCNLYGIRSSRRIAFATSSPAITRQLRYSSPAHFIPTTDDFTKRPSRNCEEGAPISTSPGLRRQSIQNTLSDLSKGLSFRLSETAVAARHFTPDRDGQGVGTWRTDNQRDAARFSRCKTAISAVCCARRGPLTRARVRWRAPGPLRAYPGRCRPL